MTDLPFPPLSAHQRRCVLQQSCRPCRELNIGPVFLDWYSRLDALRLPAHIWRRGEAAKFKLLRLHLLTCRSPRFGMFGEAERHGVRSVICTNHAGRSDVQTARQSRIFTSWCVPPISRFGEFLIELVPLDRIGSFSQGFSSSSFITWVVRGNPRSVRRQHAFTPNNLFLIEFVQTV